MSVEEGPLSSDRVIVGGSAARLGQCHLRRACQLPGRAWHHLTATQPSVSDGSD